MGVKKEREREEGAAARSRCNREAKFFHVERSWFSISLRTPIFSLSSSRNISLSRARIHGDGLFYFYIYESSRSRIVARATYALSREFLSCRAAK